MATACTCVLDASAMLAFMFQERGADEVEDWLDQGATVSALSIQETVSKLVQKGASVHEATEAVTSLGLDVRALVMELAIAAGAMFPLTKVYGLSHGDRACLALGISLGVPVVTADANWSKVASQLSVDVRQFR